VAVRTIARKPTRVLALALGATIFLAGVQAPPASATLTLAEKKLVMMIHEARAKHGKSKLKVSGSLSELAKKHSTYMKNHGSISHSSTSQLFGYMNKANCVAKIGENVGVAYSVQQMHEAFMSSSGHKANILGAWKKVGVGIRKAGGRFWTTELFCA
jgi:uncharacterized protein YkwD